jgi:hypothetical protein
VYALGIYLGGSAASLSQLLCTGGLGWRNTFLLVATLGVLVGATTAAVVREPARPALTAPTAAALPPAATAVATATPSHPLSVLGSARDVLRAPGIGWLYTAGTVRFLAGFTIMTFVPEYYRRTFPLHAASFSALNALAICVGGLLSSYAGGRIVDVVRPPFTSFPDSQGVPPQPRPTHTQRTRPTTARSDDVRRSYQLISSTRMRPFRVRPHPPSATRGSWPQRHAHSSPSCHPTPVTSVLSHSPTSSEVSCRLVRVWVCVRRTGAGRGRNTQWSRSEPRALVWVSAVGCLLGAACMLAALSATDFYVSMGCALSRQATPAPAAPSCQLRTHICGITPLQCAFGENHHNTRRPEHEPEHNAVWRRQVVLRVPAVLRVLVRQLPRHATVTTTAHTPRLGVLVVSVRRLAGGLAGALRAGLRRPPPRAYGRRRRPPRHAAWLERHNELGGLRCALPFHQVRQRGPLIQAVRRSKYFATFVLLGVTVKSGHALRLRFVCPLSPLGQLMRTEKRRSRECGWTARASRCTRASEGNDGVIVNRSLKMHYRHTVPCGLDHLRTSNKVLLSPAVLVDAR